MQAPCWEWCVTSCFPPLVWRKIDTVRRRATPNKQTNLRRIKPTNFKEETKEQLIDALNNTGYIIADYQRLEKYSLVLIVCRIAKKGL